MPYINGINVVYGDHIGQKPNGAIQESTGQDPDINKGFSGKFVWIVPTWTDNPNDAISGFEVSISSSEIPGLQDLSKGAGGKFRYIRPTRNGRRAIEMAVLRTKVEQTRPPTPRPYWDFISRDINAGRGGDYLYVVTKYAVQ